MAQFSGSKVTVQDIEHMLRGLGASPAYAGYAATVKALSLILEDETFLTSLTTRLYPKVAESCGTSVPSVERNIRTLIAVIWGKNRFLFQIIAGYGMATRPSVGEFLAILSTYLLYHPSKDWPEYLR